MIRILTGLCCLGLTIQSSATEAAPPTRERGNSWLLTISNDDYPTLGSGCSQPFAVSDAREVTRRLRIRNQIVTDERVLAISPDSPDPSLVPEKGRIESAVPGFLKNLGPSDTLIVYLALRGARIRNPATGRFEAYFLPSDVQPLDVRNSALSLAWLRQQLSATAAGNIVLLVDSCQAGVVGEQSQGAVSVRDIETEFSSDVSVSARKQIYAIVSSTENQRSLTLESKSQSVFCYWLCHALDGAADADGDAEVTLDELYDFLEREVSLTAENLSSGEGKPSLQTPQRFLLGNDHGNMPLFPLQPEPVLKSLNRISSLVDALIANHHDGFSSGEVPRISVLEFCFLTDTGTLHQPPETQLRGPLGCFGVMARNILEKRLNGRNTLYTGRNYSLVQMASISEQLQGVSLSEVMTSKINRISSEVDAIVVGTFTRLRNRQESAESADSAQPDVSDRLHLDLKLIQLQQKQTKSPAVIASVASTIVVNEELWTLLEDSGGRPRMSPAVDTIRIPGSDRDTRQVETPKVPIESELPKERPYAPQMAPDSLLFSHDVEEQSELKMEDILPVEITRQPENGSPTPVRWIATSSTDSSSRVFGVSRNDELSLHLRSKSKDWLAVIVMVDGLNVIGGDVQVPSEARYWLIPPGGEGTLDQWLSGSSSPTTDGSGHEKQRMQGNKFKVVNAPESLARQQGLTSQPGEFRFMIYETTIVPPAYVSLGADTPGNLGLSRGRSVENVFPVYRDRVIDHTKLIGKFVVNYTDQSALNNSDFDSVAGVKH